MGPPKDAEKKKKVNSAADLDLQRVEIRGLFLKDQPERPPWPEISQFWAQLQKKGLNQELITRPRRLGGFME